MQRPGGKSLPRRRNSKCKGSRTPWRFRELRAHVAGAEPAGGESGRRGGLRGRQLPAHAKKVGAQSNLNNKKNSLDSLSLFCVPGTV